MQIKTVTTTGGVNTVDFGNTSDKFYWIKNVGSTTIHASTKSDVAAGADGTVEIAAGGSAMLENYEGTIYILGEGRVEIYETSTSNCPFKQAATDYSGDISEIYTLIPVAANTGNKLTDKAYVDGGLNTKVDKADGMGLSSNDYTTAEKNKLSALTNYDDSTVNSAIADLQTNKADKSETYTKAETDTKITEKVAEIVADAPEDFNTLKEMSDWISNHETSAASMNSAIQTNTSNISNLQAGKVDKETGKSLVPDSEIARLSAVDNYDDTAVKADIQAIQGLIPSSASAENQLADKAYVDTAIGDVETVLASLVEV